MLWLAVLPLARAGDPLPAAPFVRVETGRHLAFVHALALHEAAGVVYSASEDKTVRKWRIADGRLLDTFRVPSGLRGEGQLYALALSPDGAVLAAGGWTCWQFDRRACIYLLNAATGAIIARIGGLEEIVASLRFSPDGRFLAVGLMGAQGLRVFRVADRTLVSADRDFRDKLLEVDFSPGGRIVAAGLDGFVRSYDEGFALAGRIDAGLAGRQPFGVRYSPDGRFVAVAFNDVSRISILRGSDLSVVATLAAPTGTVARNLSRVAWSADSSVVFAAGESRDGNASALFRWSLSDAAHAQALPGARGRIGDLCVTRDHLLLFGSEEPSLGLIEPSGRLRYGLFSGVPDFRGLEGRLRVSHDGSVVELSVGPGADSMRRFSFARQTLERVMAPSLPLPRTTAADWRIESWGRTEPPVINGRRLALEAFELTRSRAVSADGTTLIVGTEWALHAVDRRGAIRWKLRMPTLVRATTISGDGRFVVAALGDGSIHWLALRDGTPAVSLFVHADGEGWVAWLPDGRYASSAYGDTLAGWHINRGADASPDFFRAVQFERELYRPDTIARALAEDARTGAGVAAADALGLLAIAPPRLDVSILDAGPAAGRTSRRIRITGESLGLPMHSLSVYVNDIPITRTGDQRLAPAEAMRFTREVSLPQSAAETDVRVEVFNGRSLGVRERFAPGPAVAARSEPGNLYVIAIGANEFPELSRDRYLAYAARDAEEFAGALQALGATRFRKVRVRILSDSTRPATQAAVLDALRTMGDATGDDTTVVFMASHGVSDAAGNYYFVPRDVRGADLDDLLDGKPMPPQSSLLGWRPIFDALRTTAGRRLLIVDTCHARNISGRFQDFSLVKRSASSHIAFILASRGDEESQEYARGGHGLFTYALLEGLRGSADRDRDARITVDEWFGFAAARVDQLRDRTIGPQTPQLIAPAVLRAMSIVERPLVMR
jgi:WD40 repeat protein